MLMARRVRSGDPDNLQAQAAQEYRPAQMGADFRRESHADSANPLVNCGDTVMLSGASRPIIGAGLLPALGAHHQSASRADRA